MGGEREGRQSNVSACSRAKRKRNVTLTSIGQDYHDLFVVDLLHEIELGVWKSILTHLIRMIYAIPGDRTECVGILDDR